MLSTERPLPDYLSTWLQSADPEGAAAHKVDAFFHSDPDQRRDHAIFQLKAREELQRLRSLLEGPLVLLKGLEVAQLYPEPWQRDFICLLYTSPSPRDKRQSRMPSSA